MHTCFAYIRCLFVIKVLTRHIYSMYANMYIKSYTSKCIKLAMCIDEDTQLCSCYKLCVSLTFNTLCKIHNIRESIYVTTA